jgi:protein-L-isoaspartate(D-aspartate) O-methyltransferase
MDFVAARHRMVEHQLRGRGIHAPRVLAALGVVPRERFIAAELAQHAYDDRPLPIAAGQTISQPYIVARMCEALELGPTDHVLEVGTGSGYAAAVLAQTVAEVYTIERQAALADTARVVLAELGYTNVEVRCGDGTLGWPEHAPYDAIVVAAAGPDVPQALCAQLEIGGRLVMPVETDDGQHLVRVTRIAAEDYRREELEAVVFVPLIGEQGYAERCA